MKVKHNPAQQHFSASEEGGSLLAAKPGDAITVHYRMEGPQRMVIASTYVPVALRGGGRAAEITRAVLKYAAGESFTVIPQCSYTRRYLERNPSEFPGLSVEVV